MPKFSQPKEKARLKFCLNEVREGMNNEYLVITLISLAVSLILQPVRKYADRQAHRSYIKHVGVDHATETPEHVWLEDRHLVGRWGCFYIILQALQGIAIILTIGGIVYWWLL